MAAERMKDFRPHNWPPGRVTAPHPPAPSEINDPMARAARLRAAMDELPEVEVPLREEA
jgi:hypothetical protein